MRSMICFGRVMHARLRPKRNVFRYRVFFLRFPVTDLDGLAREPRLAVVGRRVAEVFTAVVADLLAEVDELLREVEVRDLHVRAWGGGRHPGHLL